MTTEVRFGLDPDGGADKGFLSGAFLERVGPDSVAVGVAHRDGGAYAYASISKQQFMAAVHLLFPEEFE